MSWNYRIVQSHDDPPSFSVYEVYWRRNKPCGWCEASVCDWDTLEDLKGTIKHMQRALSQPMLQQDGDTLVPMPRRKRR